MKQIGGGARMATRLLDMEWLIELYSVIFTDDFIVPRLNKV